MADLYGLLRSAVRDDNPVLVFEHKNLFGLKGDVSEEALVPLGVASVARSGNDVTIVATQQMRHRSMAAADILQRRGIEAEVIDPRTLIPFDDDAVTKSLQRTARLVVAQEAPLDGSWGASLVARVTTNSFSLLDAPPVLLAADSTPIPYAASLEAGWAPSVEGIVAAVEGVVSY